MAAAFTATSSAIQNNADFFRATQAARISVNQMLNQMRQADSVAVPSASEVDVTLAAQVQAAQRKYPRVRLTIRSSID